MEKIIRTTVERISGFFFFAVVDRTDSLKENPVAILRS
jgi:hypothetical protein